MGDRPLPIEVGANVRSRIAFVAGCVLLMFAVAGAFHAEQHAHVTLVARIVWAAALFAASRLLLRHSERWAEPLVTACFLVSVTALSVIAVSGERGNTARAFLVTAPLIFATLVPDAVRGLVVATAATVAASVVTQLVMGGSATEAALDALRAATAGAVAVLGAVSARKTRDAELALAQERARALEALERSERRQAEVEKLAAAGSRAAGVAHDMSNPLASMRCNLDWLRETAESGRFEADREEAVQVIRETRECLDRLGLNLQEFRTVARTARALALKVDELAGASSPVRTAPTGTSGE